MNGTPTKQGEERSTWLELARRQSQKLAETRAQHVPALGDWSGRVGAAREPRTWRLSWAVVLLPLLILGGATGTWAFVAHLKAQRDPQPAAVSVPPPVEPAGTAPRPAAVVRPRVVQPRPAPVEPAPPQPKRRAPRKRPPVQAKTEQPVTTATTVPSDKPQHVIFGSSSEPVIIVNPPARLGPLWTPEDYKRRGPTGTH